ncbi:hypothetical protein RHGRI_010956 [Rhododendron griersonianum]|uniref:Uncharacterized protein n=1 Tax=Rhododendron griersonianum TaxID=479676 RepID=A0AAV6KL30_9ERIC|nr:hypothetical protein RHGRI_010956 [Rhododendron griersonianum]
MASGLLVTGQGNALLMACQNKGWPRHGKPIACQQARQCIAHGMPKQGVAREWQADCMSPGKAMHWPRHDSRHAKPRGGQGMASRLLVTGQGMHCSRHSNSKGGQGMTHNMVSHAKIRGGQGMASGLLITRQGNALLIACQNKGRPRPGKLIACHRARQCIAQGMSRPKVAKA